MDYWHCNNASDTRNVLCEISKLDSVRFNYLFANIQLRFRNLYEFLLTDFFSVVAVVVLIVELSKVNGRHTFKLQIPSFADI